MRFLLGVLLLVTGGIAWLAGHEFKERLALEKQFVQLQIEQKKEIESLSQKVHNDIKNKQNELSEIEECYRISVENNYQLQKELMLQKDFNQALTQKVKELQGTIQTIKVSKNVRSVKATAYTPDPKENCGHGITWSGTPAKPGHTIAVSHDLKGWMGKYVFVHGVGVRKVEDLMPVGRTNSIDVVVHDRPAAFKFGVKRTKVTLLAKND